MRRIFMGSGAGPGGAVSYYLLVEELAGGLESYGVQVSGPDETVRLPGVTLFRDRAVALVKLLMRCGVTPVAVRDVVEDFLLA